MNDYIINSYEEAVVALKKQENSYKRNESFDVFFRGQSNFNWELVPSILRSPEQNRNENYKKYWNNHLTAFENIANIQHHGYTKTRFIDFTTNYLVALYFACEKDFDADGAVFSRWYSPCSNKAVRTTVVSELFNVDKPIGGYEFTQYIKDKYYSDDDAVDRMGISSDMASYMNYGFIIKPNNSLYERLEYICPQLKNQKGCFFVCCNETNLKGPWASDFDVCTIYPKILLSSFCQDKRFYIKYCINHKCKKEIIYNLNKIGINEKFLFPKGKNNDK